LADSVEKVTRLDFETVLGGAPNISRGAIVDPGPF